MQNQQAFQERTITIKRPEHHFVFLVAPDGAMLGLDDHGDFALYNDADDGVIWDRATGGMKHVATGKDVSAFINEDTCTLPVYSDEVIFTISHGPEKLPSVYLEHLKREGWVCVTCILTPEVLEGLERVAGTDRYEHLEMSNDIPKLCQDVAVGKAVTEPVSLWLIRQYMQTRELHLGHPPGFNRSEHKRAAMLQSFQTVDVIPKRDTRHVCGRLHESPVYQDLNNREQREITDLLLKQPPIS